MELSYIEKLKLMESKECGGKKAQLKKRMKCKGIHNYHETNILKYLFF